MTDALPAWNDGPAKQAIVDFVRRTTEKDGVDFVPPAARIAVFDNDGTLWCEQPMQAQVFFLLDRIDRLAEADPTLRTRQPFKALLERDPETLKHLGKQALFELGAAAHAGMTADEFDAIVSEWLTDARNPTLGRRFKDSIYAPQVELLTYLRANGFRTFIVTGGGIDLVRAFSEERYGIVRENVVGSSVKVRYEFPGDHAEIVKLAEIGSFNDREAKPENIYLHIGRRPIFAFGNSDGDLAMLHYTKSGFGPSLALLLHHDDAAREFSYDRDFQLSPLGEALDRAADLKFTVVSMKREWATVFGEGSTGSIPS